MTINPSVKAQVRVSYSLSGKSFSFILRLPAKTIFSLGLLSYSCSFIKGNFVDTGNSIHDYSWHNSNKSQIFMPESNLQRLIKLAEQSFAVHDDPSQINVDEAVLRRLKEIHPNTVSELIEGDGPVAWVLLIPTTLELMNLFIGGLITEKELFEKTPLHTSYEAIYLCSALVLEEFRNKGIASGLSLKAIENIRKNHPVKALFVWPFSNEGLLTSQRVSRFSGIPLYEKEV